jgi:hypothetical protein
MKAKLKKKVGDDTLKTKDTGKKKVTIKSSSNVNDSIPSISYSKNVEKPKKGIYKLTSYSHKDSIDSKGNTFYHKESNIQKKETPRRSSVISNTETGKNRFDAIDSSFTQKTRKPTTRREGYERTIISKSKLGMPDSTRMSSSSFGYADDGPTRKLISSQETFKKTPKLAKTPPKKKK